MHHASSLSSHSKASRPSILGIWRLGEMIHASKFAEVSLAQPADAVGSPRWDYVLKRNQASAGSAADNDVESRQQIERQVLACGAAMHPNLIAVLDASTAGASSYIVMPRLDGSPLSVHLGAELRVALPVALWWTRQAAQGLAAMHSAGWVHQDVKPENIMVAPRGHVTVIDLGFAARVGDVASAAFRGTPCYASPEQLDATGPVHPARDVYSLGRVLWSLVTEVEATSDHLLSPVAELIEHMVADEPNRRPTADWVSRQLLRLEIESLGRHIGPLAAIRRAA